MNMPADSSKLDIWAIRTPNIDVLACQRQKARWRSRWIQELIHFRQNKKNNLTWNTWYSLCAIFMEESQAWCKWHFTIIIFFFTILLSNKRKEKKKKKTPKSVRYDKKISFIALQKHITNHHLLEEFPRLRREIFEGWPHPKVAIVKWIREIYPNPQIVHSLDVNTVWYH